MWNPINLKKGPWDDDGRRNLYEKSFLDRAKYEKLNNFCKKIKLNAFHQFFLYLILMIIILVQKI